MRHRALRLHRAIPVPMAAAILLGPAAIVPTMIDTTTVDLMEVHVVLTIAIALEDRLRPTTTTTLEIATAMILIALILV